MSATLLASYSSSGLSRPLSKYTAVLYHHDFSCYTVTDMYRHSPFRAGYIQKIAYGGTEPDVPVDLDQPLIDPKNKSDQETGTETVGNKIKKCKYQLIIIGVIYAVLLIGVAVVASMRSKHISKHTNIAKKEKENIINTDLPEYDIVRSKNINPYLTLLAIPIVCIISVIILYILWFLGKLDKECKYEALCFYILAPLLLIFSFIILGHNVKEYRKAKKKLNKIRSNIDSFENFVKSNLYKKNLNTSNKRLKKTDGSTISPAQMYSSITRDLKANKTVDTIVENAVKKALNKKFYLTTRMDDHKKNVQNIIYTLCILQFLLDDKIDKKSVHKLFITLNTTLTNKNQSFRIADSMRTYVRPNLGNQNYIDNVVSYIQKYSTIKMDRASMKELVRQVVSQLSETSTRVTKINAHQGWGVVKKLDNEYFNIYISALVAVPAIAVFILLGMLAYKKYMNRDRSKNYEM